MILALIALIAMLFGGSSGSTWVGDIKDPLKQHVSEKDRREGVLDESNRLVEGQKTIGDSIQKQFILMFETHLDYHSTAADFEHVSALLRRIRPVRLRSISISATRCRTAFPKRSGRPFSATPVSSWRSRPVL